MGFDKILLIGSSGREAAIAKSLYKDAKLYILADRVNPSSQYYANESGGKYFVCSGFTPGEASKVASICNPDCVFLTYEVGLMQGILDMFLEQGIPAIGGTKNQTRLEWDKTYALEYLKEIDSSFVPKYSIVKSEQEIDDFEFDYDVAVKPVNPANGCGVRVMPIHLRTFDDAKDYAKKCLPDGDVLFVEKIQGREFTFQAFCDGINMEFCPVTRDYPFRDLNDTGAATAGIGCYTMPDGKLPYLTDIDIDSCKIFMTKIYEKMKQDGEKFKGIMNGGFFKTSDGIKFMEMNMRLGNPETMNLLALYNGNFKTLLELMWDGSMEPLEFEPKASIMRYFFQKSFPTGEDKSAGFEMDINKIRGLGIDIFFNRGYANIGHGFYTDGNDRAVGLVTTGKTIEEALDFMERGASYVDLDSRTDIGKFL